MNNSRRGTYRKKRNVPRENTKNTAHFAQREPKDFVEIEDDDEIQDITDPDEDLKPIQVKRRKKKLVVEEDSDDEDELGMCMDENERRQLKEALRQSRLDIEVESKRRAMNIKPGAVKLTSEVNIGNSSQNIEDESFSDNETQDSSSGNSMQSFPTSSGLVRDQLERAESPDLFGTPTSSIETEELGCCKENTKSPSKNPFRSNTAFTAGEVKMSPLDKDIIINITPVKRHFGSSKNILKLKKKDSSKEQEETGIATESKVNVTEDSSMEAKKRKHCLDDQAGHSNREEEFLLKNTKKQKLIQEVFNVRKKDEQQMSRTFTPHVVINDDDDNDDDDNDDNDDDDNDDDDNDDDDDDNDSDNDDVRLEDKPLLMRRDEATQNDKKTVKRKLERAYKKPKLSIKNIKDAMKARVYFAPPGIEPKTYTYAIMRMMDHARKSIYKAQSKSLNFIKWGKPVVVGPRELNSLDARKDKKKNIVDVASTSTNTAHETFSNERKRSLRSARPTISVPPIKAESSTDTEYTRRRTRDFVNSDDSDEELTIPVFGEAKIKPKLWKEFLPNKESETFGENVVTSAECQETALEENAFTKDSPAISNTSRSFNFNAHRSVEGNKDECINGKDKTHEKLKNVQNDSYVQSLLTSKNINDESLTKSKENLNSKQTEALGNKKGHRSPCKPMARQDTHLFELDDKEDDDIDSRIDIEINHTERRVKNALTEDLEEEAHGSLFKFGIEVADEILSGSSQADAESAQNSNPGASLTNVAEKSGYLKVNRTPKETTEVQRVMSSAVRRAVEAAKKGLQAASVSSSPEISSSTDLSQAFVSNTEDNRVKCPMCFAKFSKEDIEVHAATCDGSNAKPSYFSSSKPTTSSLLQKSIASDSKDVQLKKLKVLVTRSPEAHRKLMEQRSLSGSKARCHLTLNRRSTGDDSSSAGKGEDKSQRCINMTTDEDGDTKRESQDEKETASRESSQSFHWFSSASQVERQKNKFKVTYGAKKKKNLDPLKNPFSTLDFLPLEVYPSSGEMEYCDDANNQKRGDDDKSDKEESDQKKGDRSGDGSDGDGASKSYDKYKEESDQKNGDRSGDDSVGDGASKSYDKYGEFDSDSDKSDKEVLAAYGVKAQSKKRKRKNKDPKHRNINDILGPQKQENPKQKKRRTFESFDEDDYENERTLLELSDMPLKRSTIKNKTSETSVKPGRRRISSSDESEDNDEYEKCFICLKKVAKEDFTGHTDACLERKGEAFVTTGKGKTLSHGNRSTTNQPKTTSSEQSIEIDSDEIGDSPIKTFKLIGEDTSSCVDFSNQFSFFNNKGGNTKRGDTDTVMGKKRYRGRKFRNKGRYNYKRGRGKSKQ